MTTEQPQQPAEPPQLLPRVSLRFDTRVLDRLEANSFALRNWLKNIRNSAYPAEYAEAQIDGARDALRHTCYEVIAGLERLKHE